MEKKKFFKIFDSFMGKFLMRIDFIFSKYHQELIFSIQYLNPKQMVKSIHQEDSNCYLLHLDLGDMEGF